MTIKRLYILLILLCLGVVNTSLQAQIYSTSNYRGISTHRNISSFEATLFSNTPSFGSTSSMRLRTTSEKSYHDYGSEGRYSIYGSYTTHNRFIRTKAATISGGILADNAGYIATKPQRITTSTNGDNDTIYDDDSTENPPTDAPLAFGWDVIILLLLLAIGYTLSIRKRVNPNRSLDLG